MTDPRILELELCGVPEDELCVCSNPIFDNSERCEACWNLYDSWKENEASDEG